MRLFLREAVALEHRRDKHTFRQTLAAMRLAQSDDDDAVKEALRD